jgi:hypothetical protein
MTVRFSEMLTIKNTFTFHHHSETGYEVDRAIAKAVSPRLLTAAAWLRFQVRSCGICSAQMLYWNSFFLEYFSFLRQF